MPLSQTPNDNDIQKPTACTFQHYIMNQDPAEEIDINVQLLTRAVTTVQSLSFNHNFDVMPTGTKTYGVHLLDKVQRCRVRIPGHGEELAHPQQ